MPLITHFSRAWNEQPSGSPRFSMNATDLAGVVLMFLMVSLAAGLAWLVSVIPQLDLGSWEFTKGLVVAAISALLEFIRKWVSDHSSPA